MIERNEPERAPGEAGDGPLPNRFTRGTALGCLGILCVLTLPALLALPVEQWHLPGWVPRLIPLVGIAIVAIGASLLARVPGSAPPPPPDPQHPLTRSGSSPIREEPATGANRLGLVVALALVVCCAAGYLLVTVSSAASGGELIGSLLAWAAGMALIAYTALVVRHVLAGPAWVWVRTPIRGMLAPQLLPFAIVGFVALVWALFIAAALGYVWAPVGVGVLLLALALSGPLLRRLPPRDQR